MVPTQMSQFTQTECELKRLYGSHENKRKPVPALFAIRLEQQLEKKKLKFESLKHLLKLQEKSCKKMGQKINSLNKIISSQNGALNQITADAINLREQRDRAIEIADEFWKNQKQAVTVWHYELADELQAIRDEIQKLKSK